MVEGDGGHGAEDNGGSKAPASAWPVITMLGALVLGIVLLWWWQDEDSNLTGPVLAATIVVAALALGAWLIETISQSRREARYGDAGDARKTQVITFGIAEGKFEDAEAGILAELRDAHENLRSQAGFEDLRVIASRAESGTSQAIVETTWSSADDLSAYDSTRTTMLDLVNGHGDEVVAGSVQAFDMDVVRDTKDVFVRMGFGAAFTIVGAILAAGVVTGAIIGATSDETVAADGDGGGNGGPVASTSVQIVATDNAFDLSEIIAVANEPFTVSFINDGAVLHNIAFLTEEGGELLSPDAVTSEFIAGGSSEEFTFTAPGPGTYYFLCELHPTEMNGTFTVVEGGGGSDGGDGGASDAAPTSVDVEATDNAFDTGDIVAAANEAFTVNFVNAGAVPHNIRFLTEEGGDLLVEGAETSEFWPGGESETFEFTAPDAGTYYYQCDLHPTEMRGAFIVR